VCATGAAVAGAVGAASGYMGALWALGVLAALYMPPTAGWVLVWP
jgi:hypothetical protein